MKGKLRLKLSLILPSLAIIGFTVLTVLSLVRLDRIQSEVHIRTSQNMLWVSSRTHVAHLKLTDALMGYKLGEVTAKRLQQRLDTYLATIGVQNDGPQRRRMVALDLDADFQRLVAESHEVDALISQGINGDRSAIDAAHTKLAAFEGYLSNADNITMVGEWHDIAGKLERAQSQLKNVWLLLLAVFASGLVLVTTLLVTARKIGNRNRELRSQRHFSEILINSSEAAVIALDDAKRVQVWNPAAERLTDLSARMVIGGPLEQIAQCFHEPILARALDNCLQGIPGFVTDFPYDPSGRERMYLELRFMPLDPELGDSLRAIITIHDVTERRAAQRAIAADRDYLEVEVHRRTRELDAALDREKQASEVYRNFAAMISHQFRTPLAVTDSALQRLGRLGPGQSAEAFSERVSRARGAVARLVSLVDRTLATARLDAGQIEASEVSTDLNVLVFEIAARESLPEERLRWELPGDLPLAHCDPALTDIILSNLFANALKYAPEGGIIRVGGDGTGNRVRLSIANEGTLGPDEAAQLFDRYFRADSSRGVSGIGLGLYMARRLARLQGGSLELRQPGDGWLYFDVELPSYARPQTTLKNGEEAQDV